MGQINTNNYPTVSSLADADLLIVENATHGTGTTTPKQLRENAIGTDPLQTTAQTVTGAINEIFEMATDTVIGLELGKMTSFSDGVIVTDIDLHRAPVAGDRILFYHNTAVASPSSLTTYNDGVAVTTTIGDFSLTHPAGLTLMKCVVLGESLRWQTVQDITSGYTAGVGISINGTTINNSAPQLGDDIAYSRIDTVTSGALGYFNADADCLVMDFRTDAEPYNGGYTLRLTTTGASFKYAVLKDKAGNNYAEEIPAGSLVMCKSNVSGTGSEADPVVVTVLEIGNTEMAHDVEVLKDICITEKTVSGNPLTLTDALPYAALSLSADIVPIQDLHGFDKPWVGGADVNKFDISSATMTGYIADFGLTVAKDSDGYITITGTYSGTSAIPKFAIIPTLAKLDNAVFYCMDKNTDATANIIQCRWANNETGGVAIDLQNMVQNQTYNIKFRLMIVTDGSTPTTFRPYSNICPISGRTAVAVDDLPNADYAPFFEGVKNGTYGFVDLGSLTWVYVTSGSAHAPYFSTEYSGIKAHGNPASNPIIAICKKYNVVKRALTTFVDKTICGDGSATVISYLNVKDSAYTDAAAFKTAMSGVYLIYELATPTTPSYTAEQWAALVNSFGGYDVTIQLGQTVYGDSLNVTTGVMTETKSEQLLDLGNVNWTYLPAGYMRSSDAVANVKIPVNEDTLADIMCSHFGTASANAVYNHNTGIAIDSAGKIRVFYDGMPTNATDFKNAMNGVKLSYELATPTTLQFTPTQLKLLEGYNRLSSDGGGDITLTYKADRLAAIEAALAALQ